jgi:hypothetical protein
MIAYTGAKAFQNGLTKLTSGLEALPFAKTMVL